METLTRQNDPTDRDLHTQYRVWLIEKLIINFALPSDLVFHTMRAFREHDHSQSVLERIVAMWKGKVSKYQKLLRLKEENGGVIPADYQAICRQTPCGKTRLFLAMAPWRRPRARRRKGPAKPPIQLGPAPEPARAAQPLPAETAHV